MRILKLLNKKYLSIIIILLIFGFDSFSEEEPVDIWNIDKKKIEVAADANSFDERNISTGLPGIRIHAQDKSGIFNLYMVNDIATPIVAERYYPCTLVPVIALSDFTVAT